VADTADVDISGLIQQNRGLIRNAVVGSEVADVDTVLVPLHSEPLFLVLMVKAFIEVLQVEFASISQLVFGIHSIPLFAGID